MITNAILSQFASVEPLSSNYLVGVNDDGLKALVSIRDGKRVSPFLYTEITRDGKEYSAKRPDGAYITATGIKRFIAAIAVPLDPITSAVFDLTRKFGASLRDCIGFVHGVATPWPVWVFQFREDGSVFNTSHIDNVHDATRVSPWGDGAFKVRIAPENIADLEYRDAFITALKNSGFSKGKTKQYYGNEVSWLTKQCADQADVLHTLAVVGNVFDTCSIEDDEVDNDDADDADTENVTGDAPFDVNDPMFDDDDIED